MLGKMKEYMKQKKMDMDNEAVKLVASGNTKSYSANRAVRVKANEQGYDSKVSLVDFAKKLRTPKIMQGK